MIVKALSQIALDLRYHCIHRNGSSVHCCHHEYDYPMQLYLASICHDFVFKFLCVPGNLPAMCWPMGTVVISRVWQALHRIWWPISGMGYSGPSSYQYGWVKACDHICCTTKDKQAILLHISKGGWLHWLVGGIKRFIPAHRPAPIVALVICSLFVLI